MKIKIAIIGSEDFCHRTEQVMANHHDVELVFYRYTDPQEAAALIASITPCDAILFSGSLPYTYAKEAIQTLTVPISYLEQDETAIAITLLHLASHHQIELHRLSIDVRDVSLLNHVLHDIHRFDEPPFIHVLQQGHSIEEITAYHSELAMEGKTDMAVTSVHAVYERLQALQIPSMKMIDPESSITQCIEHMKQAALLQKSDAAQTAVGVIKGYGPDTDLLPFVERVAGHLQAHWTKKEEEYLLFTTMGQIGFSLKSATFLSTLKSAAGTASISFGSGESIVEATENAYFALDFNRKKEGFSFYLLDGAKKLHGPYPNSSDTVRMKINEPALLEMANKTKLSSMTISKLMVFSQSRQSKQFTANDLASHLQVTRRTAERTLKRLMELSYVKIVGEEMTYRQGRPRALYEFNFSTFT
ncbi:HTH domain-containing protein [Sporosarcina sp. 179-K 3D1 HS]|uniref:hypothetical protein n=1 Tax=Sporosarcina sp. 179-K 3D1 HS TaxID=3232169 RepID=UPI00399F45F3